MDRDARNVLNMRRNNQSRSTMQSRSSFRQRNPAVNDARHVLNLKKSQGVQKAKHTQSLRGGRRNFNQRGSFIKPQFRQQNVNARPFNVNKRLGQNTNARQFNMNNRLPQNLNTRPFNVNKRLGQNPNKSVQFARNGGLKITSRNRNQNRSQQVTNLLNSNRFVSGMSDLTVVARNRPATFSLDDEMLVDAVDNGDELERMTLQDIPEISSMKDLPLSFLSQKKATPWQNSSSASSTLFSRLAKSVGNHTMIADTISSPGNLTSDWKILVTNLKSTVSQSDIAELFGYVGSLKSAEIIRPGVALVIYYSKEDAVKAYSSYNDRLLDGVPMQCIFPNSQTSVRTPITSRLGGKFISGQSAFSHQLSGSSAASRKVAFTVKLP